MKQSSPNGPTIPDSTNFQSSFTRILKVTEKIQSDLFKISRPAPPAFTTLSNGYLSNLNDPIDDQDGATLAYTSSSGGGSVGGPSFSIQYNNSNTFAGSNSLLFNPNGTPTLTADFITDTVLTIGSGTVNNLDDPILPQQAATKNYVDSFFGVKLSNSLGNGVTYTASDMINGIISRTGWSGTSADTTASATDIINFLGVDTQINSTFNFSIKNINLVSYSNIIQLAAGTDVTIFPSTGPIIYPGYQFNCLIHVTSITPPAVTLYTVSSNITNSPNFSIQISGAASLAKTLNISDYLLVKNSPREVFTGISILPSDVAKKVIIRKDMSSDVTDFLSPPDVFMGVFENTNIISSAFIWNSGGLTFYIVNQGSYNITLNGENSTNYSWTIDANSNRKIPPGYTGYFMISLDVNYPVIINGAYLYTLGIFPSN